MRLSLRGLRSYWSSRLSIARSLHLGDLIPGVLFAAIVMIGMSIHGAPIPGPFIMLDELEYFSYGRDLYSGVGLGGHIQYGPMYPAIIATAFHLGDAESAYNAVRAFNIVVLALSILPAFALARGLFPAQRALHALFPVIAVTTPFTGLGYVVWADPLYYLLFLASLVALMKYLDAPTIGRGIAVGLLAAFLFHTKSGAGLIAAGGTLAAAALAAMRPARGGPRDWRPVYALLLTLAAITLPGILRNISLGAGIIGYSSGDVMAHRIAIIGRAQLILDTLSSSLYQLTYLFVASVGLLGAAIAVPVLCWRSLSRQQRGLAVFLGIYMVGLVVVSAVGMVSYSGFDFVPNGRYLSVMAPATMLLALGVLRTCDDVPRMRAAAALAGIVLAALLLYATPLYVLTPYSFVNNTELALINSIVDNSRVIWRGKYEPSTFQIIVLAASFGAVSLAWALARRSWAVTLLAVSLVAYNAWVSLEEHRYVRIVSEAQRDLNLVIRHLLQVHAAPYRDVLFDYKLRSAGLVNHLRFWYPDAGTPRYAAAREAATLAHGSSPTRYFVSPAALPYAVSYRTENLTVYRLPIADAPSSPDRRGDSQQPAAQQ